MMLYLALFFWIFHIVRRTLFYLYLWQIKESRIDRFIDEWKSRKSLFFPPSSFGACILLLSIFFASPKEHLQEYAVFLFYFLFGSYAIFLAVRKRVRMPKEFTRKMIVLALFTIFTESVFLLVFFSHVFLYILVLEIVLPLAVFLCGALLQFPVFFIRTHQMKNAQKKREGLKNVLAIGITGSYGKTSVKEFLYAILSKKYTVLKTAKHINTEIGVAHTILNKLTNEHQIFICEMGAYRKGEVKTSCDMVKPNIGIVTGANEQHLSLFGSMQNLLSAEGGEELVKALPSGGTAIANADSELLWRQKSELEQCNPDVQKFIWCSAKTKSGVWANQLVVEKDSLRFTAHINGEEAEIRANLIGGYNVENLLLAIGAAKEAGMSLPEIAAAASAIPQELGAMKLRKTASGLNVIESTYSANPSGVFAALEYLKLWQGNPSTELRVKKILVMPCLIELGKASEEVHKRIGEKIAEVCDLAIITTKDRFHDIKQGAGGSEKVVFMENSAEIVQRIKSTVSAGDTVLLEGRVPQVFYSIL